MRRAVFLDRDGTLNETAVVDGVPKPPTRAEDLRLLPGVREAVDRLRAAGLLLVVATNQPDVARGTLERERVEEMHTLLHQILPLDDVLCCYHDDPDRCACRKPRPGLLVDAAQRFRVDLPASFMVGDRWRDVEAGRQAGCTTILLARSYSEASRSRPDYQADDLAEATDIILSSLEGRAGEDLR
jgi:D-glycero-D-manno-heptose 1,7-bisphosphate phosphatase